MTYPPTAIVFDAVGTLIHPNPSVARVYAEHGRRFGCLLTEAEVHDRFRQAFASQEEIDRRHGGQLTSEARERRRWQAIISQVFPNPREPAALFDALWNHFRQPSSWAIFDDVADCWRQLRASGLRLALASNFDARLLEICRGLPPFDHSCRVFISSRLGYRKPSPRFFTAVAERLELPPARIVMVGDDVSNDFDAAGAAGWQALLIDRSAKTSSAHRISSLRDLPQRLLIEH